MAASEARRLARRPRGRRSRGSSARATARRCRASDGPASCDSSPAASVWTALTCKPNSWATRSMSPSHFRAHAMARHRAAFDLERGRCRALNETSSLSNAVPPRRMSRSTSIGRRWLRRSASSRLTPRMAPSAASSDAVPVRLAIAAAGEAPEASSENRARAASLSPIGRPKSATAAPRSASLKLAARAELEVSPDAGDARLRPGGGRHKPQRR